MALRQRFVLIVLLLTLQHCALVRDHNARDHNARERAEREREGSSAPQTNSELRRQIAAMSRGERITALRISVDWLRSGTMTSADLDGNGSGVFEDRVALNFPPAAIAAAVRALSQSGFASMSGRYGEGDSDFMAMRGRVTVETDRTDKTVFQMVDGPQSEPLAILAAEIITLAEQASALGVTVEDLGEALAKLAAGEIPAEAFRMTLQRRDDRPQPSEPGWLLKMHGREVEIRSFIPGKNFGPPRRERLGEEEFRQIAATLRDAHPATLPANMYAPIYTDFHVEVLGKSRDLQARRWGGVTALTHGAQQQAFDRLVDRFQSMARRNAEPWK